MLFAEPLVVAETIIRLPFTDDDKGNLVYVAMRLFFLYYVKTWTIKISVDPPDELAAKLAVVANDELKDWDAQLDETETSESIEWDAQDADVAENDLDANDADVDANDIEAKLADVAASEFMEWEAQDALMDVPVFPNKKLAVYELDAKLADVATNDADAQLDDIDASEFIEWEAKLDDVATKDLDAKLDDVAASESIEWDAHEAEATAVTTAGVGAHDAEMAWLAVIG